jgi:hypothetical protein
MTVKTLRLGEKSCLMRLYDFDGFGREAADDVGKIAAGAKDDVWGNPENDILQPPVQQSIQLPFLPKSPRIAIAVLRVVRDVEAKAPYLTGKEINITDGFGETVADNDTDIIPLTVGEIVGFL